MESRKDADMVNRLLVDWFSFSVRIDEKADRCFEGTLDVHFICRLIGIPFEDFVYIGKVKYYKECYKCGDISINVPFDGKESTQGYFVNMSGSGCRYFEQESKQGEFVHALDIWRGLAVKLRSLTSQGLSITIPRFDLAVDDFTGALDMERIKENMLDGNVSSRFQTKHSKLSGQVFYTEDYSFSLSERHNIRGQTVYFGSEHSRTFCRFYDKKAEQLQKHYADAKKFGEIEKIPHWVRMEFVFKDENAIKICNALCDEKDFPAFYARYVNGMIRFIHRDDSNVSRCTTQSWWADFIGTTEKVSLSVASYEPISRERHMRYTYHQLYGVIYTAMNIEGVDAFLENICSLAYGKLKRKHRMLCAGEESELKDLCSRELWDALKATHKNAVPDYGEYHYTDGAAICLQM